MNFRIDAVEFRNNIASFYEFDDSVDLAAAEVADVLNTGINFAYQSMVSVDTH